MNEPTEKDIVEQLVESLNFLKVCRENIDYLVLLVRSEGATADADSAVVDLLQNLRHVEISIEEALGTMAMIKSRSTPVDRSGSN